MLEGHLDAAKYLIEQDFVTINEDIYRDTLIQYHDEYTTEKDKHKIRDVIEWLHTERHILLNKEIFQSVIRKHCDHLIQLIRDLGYMWVDEVLLE